MKHKKIKRFIGIAVLVLFAVVFLDRAVYASRAHVSDPVKYVLDSHLYTDDELEEVAEAVVEDFKTFSGYKGCKLTQVRYCEAGEEKNEMQFRVYYREGRHILPIFETWFPLSLGSSSYTFCRTSDGASWILSGWNW